MELSKSSLGLLYLLSYISIATTFLTQCEARGLEQHKSSLIKSSRKPRPALRFELYSSSDPYFSSAEIYPPYCVNPPLTPLPPSTTIPTPTTPIQSPLPPPPSTPTYISPPMLAPNPPAYVPGPPTYIPSPPTYVPSPPELIPSPPEFVPGPPIFLPPVVYPPPFGPPPPAGTLPGLWCVAKPTVPDPIIQEAMDYACGSGADCDSIQPGGACYQPDTLLAHASYAFNSYWQRTKVAGGTCDFGGTAMLITIDPSFDGCHFNLM